MQTFPFDPHDSKEVIMSLSQMRLSHLLRDVQLAR